MPFSIAQFCSLLPEAVQADDHGAEESVVADIVVSSDWMADLLLRSDGSIRLPECGKVFMSGLTGSHNDVRAADRSKFALALESKGVK